MTHDSQRQLFEAINTHNVMGVDRALEAGARWDLDMDGHETSWNYGDPTVSIWRYTAAMMAFHKFLNTERTTIVKKINIDQDTWGRVIGAVLSNARFVNIAGQLNTLDAFQFLYDRWPERHLGNWHETATKEGGTILHLVASNKHRSTDIVQHLVASGFDVNTLDSRGQTPLHLAKSEEIITALLSLGGNAALVDAKGYTPAMRLAKLMIKQDRANNQKKQTTPAISTKSLSTLLDFCPIEDNHRSNLLARDVGEIIALRKDKEIQKKGLERLAEHIQTYERRKKLTLIAEKQKTKRENQHEKRTDSKRNQRPRM